MISFKKWKCPEDGGPMTVKKPFLTASFYTCNVCGHAALVDHNKGEVCELGEGGSLVKTGEFLEEYTE